jgi:outer membrane protein TolC
VSWTLQHCLDTALQSRPDLKSSEAQVRAAKAVVGQSMSNYYPQVNFSSTVQRSGGPDRVSVTQGSTAAGIPNVTTFNTITNTTVSSLTNTNIDTLTVSQYITDFGRTTGLVTASQESYMASVYDLITLKNNVINSVKKSFYTCIAAQELLKAKEENVAVSETHLKQSQAFYDVGRRSKIEVTKSEVDLAQARLDMINADNSYKVARFTVINAMGLDHSVPFELARDLSLPEMALTLDEVMKTASVHRPELLKSDAQIRAQKGRLAAALAGYYPTITGNAQYNWRGSDYPLERYWQLGVTLSLPITDGNMTLNRVKESRSIYESLTSTRNRLWQNIALELEQAWLAIKASREKITVSETSLRQAEENFRLAQGRYAVGVGSNLEFSDAQVLLLQAKTDYISALVQYFNAVADLEKSMGIELKTLAKEVKK